MQLKEWFFCESNLVQNNNKNIMKHYRGKRSLETLWQIFFFWFSINSCTAAPYKNQKWKKTLKNYLLSSALHFPHIVKRNCIVYMKKKGLTVIQWHKSMSKFHLKKKDSLPCPLYLCNTVLPLKLQSYYVQFNVFCSIFCCSAFINVPYTQYAMVLK